jgi:lipopolysaccharide transport protein LptA
MKTNTFLAAILVSLPQSLPIAAQQDEGSLQSAKPAAGALGMFSPMASGRPAGALTEISAEKEASFDSEKSIAEFSGKVVVRDPQFSLACETLTVRLRSDRKGIDSAEANGNVVIVQQKSDPADKSEPAVGKAGRVVYKPDAGEMVLSDWPSIRQGINKQVATEASTTMVLRANGQSRTTGGSKTVITDTSAKP